MREKKRGKRISLAPIGGVIDKTVAALQGQLAVLPPAKQKVFRSCIADLEKHRRDIKTLCFRWVPAETKRGGS